MMIRFVVVLLLIFPFSGHSYAATSLPLTVKDGVTLDATYFAASRPGPGLLFLNMCDPPATEQMVVDWFSKTVTQKR